MKKILLMLTILVQVSIVFSQTHFVQGFIGSGTDQMTIVIKSAEIGGTALQANDEIAVFDGNLCVGVVKLSGVIDPLTPATFATISASTEGGTGGDNGFIPTHKMYFRFWDSSAGIEYHNIIPVVKDNAENIIANQFTSNLTVFVYASTENTTKTWTGSDDGISWNNDFNWDPEGIPEPSDDVIIPNGISAFINISANSVNCGSLSFDDQLRINSGSTTTGSLIVTGSISGSGTVQAKRYSTLNAWHLISSQVSGQTISDFLTLNGAVATNGASRGMMDYDEANDDWSIFFTNGKSGDLTSGKGFGIRTTSSTAVTHTGSLINNTVNVGVTKSNFGWNLVGNPYTSAIYTRQEVNGFLTVNAGALDPSFRAMYLWDEGADAYTVINSFEGESKLASGQGFFIKAASVGSVNFTQAMQAHQTDAPFKSAVINPATIVLKAKAGEIFSTTKIGFNEEMTLGLDPSYDAGILRSGNGFDIYSKLVNDNGVDFAIQWLPGKSSDRYVIPVGVDATKGGEVVFSVQTLNLPTDYNVIIEDKLTKTQTNIKNGEMYVAEISENSKGTGRFYLHVGSSLQTGINEIQKEELVVYTIDNTVYIKGDVGNNAQFAVYSIDGRLINQFGATSQNLNQMSISGYTSGVYFISVQSNIKYKPVKFVVGN